MVELEHMKMDRNTQNLQVVRNYGKESLLLEYPIRSFSTGFYGSLGFL